MPTPIDFALLAFITIVSPILSATVFFPRFKADVSANKPGARSRAYRRGVISQWLVTAVVGVIWIVEGRTWGDLGFAAPEGARLWIGLAVSGILSGFLLYQPFALSRATSEQIAQLRTTLASLAFMLPHTRGELRWFHVVSITAGICEELLFRGFLVWVLKPFLGIPGALIAGVVLFGLGHAYQGWGGVLKTGIAGLVFAALVFATGWLIPAIMLHAANDLQAGMLSYAMLKDDDAPDAGHLAPGATNPS